MSNKSSELPPRTVEFLGEFHVGRTWSGSRIEDECGCLQHACGLVTPSVDCPEHDPVNAKTIRQGHVAAACPGAPA